MEIAAFLAPATTTGTACRDGRIRVKSWVCRLSTQHLGPDAEDVPDDQPDRAGDGGVGAESRAERASGGVAAQLAAHRPVDHDQRRRAGVRPAPPVGSKIAFGMPASLLRGGRPARTSATDM
jgi:hypothetical protein